MVRKMGRKKESDNYTIKYLPTSERTSNSDDYSNSDLKELERLGTGDQLWNAVTKGTNVNLTVKNIDSVNIREYVKWLLNEELQKRVKAIEIGELRPKSFAVVRKRDDTKISRLENLRLFFESVGECKNVKELRVLQCENFTITAECREEFLKMLSSLLTRENELLKTFYLGDVHDDDLIIRIMDVISQSSVRKLHFFGLDCITFPKNILKGLKEISLAEDVYSTGKELVKIIKANNTTLESVKSNVFDKEIFEALIGCPKLKRFCVPMLRERQVARKLEELFLRLPLEISEFKLKTNFKECCLAECTVSQVTNLVITEWLTREPDDTNRGPNLNRLKKFPNVSSLRLNNETYVAVPNEEDKNTGYKYHPLKMKDARIAIKIASKFGKLKTLKVDGVNWNNSKALWFLKAFEAIPTLQLIRLSFFRLSNYPNLRKIEEKCTKLGEDMISMGFNAKLFEKNDYALTIQVRKVKSKAARQLQVRI